MSRFEINFCLVLSSKIVGGIENLIVTFSKKMNILLCYSFHSGDEVWACPQCDVTSSYLPFWWWWWTQSCFSTLRLKNWSNGLSSTSFCSLHNIHSSTFLLTLRCPLIFLFYKMPLLGTLFEIFNFCPKIQLWFQTVCFRENQKSYLTSKPSFLVQKFNFRLNWM